MQATLTFTLPAKCCNITVFHYSGIIDELGGVKSGASDQSSQEDTDESTQTKKRGKGNNSYVPSFQQHLNIIRSTCKLQTSDFVELQNDFLQLCCEGSTTKLIIYGQGAIFAVGWTLR